MHKWVYSFGPALSEGRADMKDLLGGKGANLAEMASLGLPVPSGFTITTEVCTYITQHDGAYPPELLLSAMQALARIEAQLGTEFGSEINPLLLAVRSGARVSMPGMMDTILNLGLNDMTVQGLAKTSGDERFAWDSYRRFIQMYSNVVFGVSPDLFEDIIDDYKQDNKWTEDNDVPALGWKNIVTDFKNLILQETGKPFPQDVQEQLWAAIGAVFRSWMTPRAVTYRKINSIPENWGTAVNVQAMVFGNMSGDSATGVAFTRDPSTGENYFYGEYLLNAQGEDVVSGIHTPQPLSRAGRDKDGRDVLSMEELMPIVYAQLDDARQRLEKHFGDIQYIEFTVQKGKLYLLQTRSGKCLT